MQPAQRLPGPGTAARSSEDEERAAPGALTEGLPVTDSSLPGAWEMAATANAALKTATCPLSLLRR